jgi:hypothetical protein
MIKKKAKQSKPSCYFKVGFFLEKKKEKKRLFKISIFFFIVLLLLLDYCLGISHHTHFLEARTTLFELINKFNVNFQSLKKQNNQNHHVILRLFFFLVS